MKNVRLLGLRQRLVLVFSVGALLVATLMAVAAQYASQNYLLRQREAAALSQTQIDAAYVQDRLASGAVGIEEALGGLDGPLTSTPIAQAGGAWYSSTLVSSGQAVPAGLESTVSEGRPARQRIDVGGSPVLVIGLPLPDVDDTF